MREQRRWLVWRVERNQKGQPTKVPYVAGKSPFARHASSTDPETWETFEAAVNAVGGVLTDEQGIGFAFEGSGITGCDFDHVLYEGGDVRPWTDEIVSLQNTYSEVSPSGDGVHTYVFGSFSGAGVKREFESGEGFEMYCRGRFFCVTGRQLVGAPDTIRAYDCQTLADRARQGDVGPDEDRIREAAKRQNSAKNGRNRNRRPFDVEAFLARHLSVLSGPKQVSGTTIWTVECQGSHPDYDPRDGRAFVAQLASGAISAACLHESCSFSNANNQNHWRELRERYERRAAGPDSQSDGEPAGGSRGPLTEERLAQQFEVQYHDQLHYDHDAKRWYVWDGERGCWVRNQKRLAFHFARQICRASNPAGVKEFAKAKTYAGVEQICQCSPIFAVTAEKWDQNIWFLGVPGGTIDLHTGKPRPSSKQDYITKQTSVAPDSSMPRPVFDRFLRAITQKDKKLQRYLQRIAGYALTGSNREEKLFFLYGPGGNGKTKLVEAWAGAMGDYATTAAMDTFVLKRGERHPTDLAGLAGARLVISNETHEGRHWDQQLVQDITGGSSVSARFMRRDFFRYIPQFTLVIVGNHAPKLDSINDAAMRRFQVIPFTFKPKTPDQELANKLSKEWPAILAWMIDGAREWCAHGLGERPKIVEQETREYFDDQNQLQAWIDEMCLVGLNVTDTSKQLYASWERWSVANGEERKSKDWLIKALKQQHGCHSQKVNRERGLKGICVKVEYKPDPRTGEKD
jgi:putative DNA primase/helicase